MHATLYTFVIPRDYNDGQYVSDAVRERLEAWLLDFGGGFTRRDADGSAWRNSDTGQVYRDERVSLYDVLVPRHDVRNDANAKQIARDIAAVLDQDAVLWYRVRVYGGFEEQS